MAGEQSSPEPLSSMSEAERVIDGLREEVRSIRVKLHGAIRKGKASEAARDLLEKRVEELETAVKESHQESNADHQDSKVDFWPSKIELGQSFTVCKSAIAVISLSLFIDIWNQVPLRCEGPTARAFEEFKTLLNCKKQKGLECEPLENTIRPTLCTPNSSSCSKGKASYGNILL